MKIKILFATSLTLALFSAGYAQTLDNAKLDQFFDRLAEKNNAMGSLTIAKDGNVLYTRAIGYSQINGAEKKPLTAANRFRIGSITKMFTAAMIFQLVEEGKLKLTDTLDKFFPQVPNAKKITIVQILGHRSGIPNVRRDQNDLAKFIQALFDGKIVSKENLDQMKTIRDGDGLGLGMEPFTFAGKTFYGHAGGGDNYGAWLACLPEEKLAVAYTTNAKVYPVVNIVRGVVDIYYNKPFQIPALESIAVSPEVLDKYVGVYSSPEAPVKWTITRDGGTLFFQPPGAGSAVPLEATAENKFQIEGAAVFEFDAAKNQMIIKRRGGQERVLTKEK
jgi:CubicO group peptidase (beta-lactamase class C family)